MANILRHYLFLLVFLATAPVVVGQANLKIDQEYIATCLVDSLPDGGIVRFQRITLIADRSFFDIDKFNAPYTPVGTLLTCEEYDLAQIIRDPALDLYENCQCTYTINQDNHWVPEILGGADQQYVVEFQEVVRRQCSGQESTTVVHRDTLRDTVAINNFRLQNSFPFDSNGDFVDDYNLRVYGSGNPAVVTVDLNPATVQASYPALTVNATDFEFNGSNLSDIAAAYEVVINYAVNQVFGNVVNPITVITIGSSVVVQVPLQHNPNFPYVIRPDPLDADYLISANFGIITSSVGRTGHQTRTSNYLVDCGVIFTRQSAVYLNWNRLAPLSLVPEVNPSQTFIVSSVPTISCATDPQVCAGIIPDITDINGCVEECTDLLNVAGHRPVNNETLTLTAGVYNSISVFVTTGPVQIEIDGIPINYPTNWTSSWSASPRKTLNNNITITAPAGSEAIISYVR